MMTAIAWVFILGVIASYYLSNKKEITKVKKKLKKL